MASEPVEFPLTYKPPVDGDLYVAHSSGCARFLRALRSARPEIRTYETGSAVYKAGAMETDDTEAIRELLDLILDSTVWVVWDGIFIRINAVSQTAHETCVIECDQSAQIGVAIINGCKHTLRLVEPSPPKPVEEWFDTERARAIRDLVGDQQPRPLVLVPFQAWEDRL